MVKINDRTLRDSLGLAFSKLLFASRPLNNKELVLNSNNGKMQSVFLDNIESIEICEEGVLFYGKNGTNDFLNLENILSITILGD